MYRLKLKKNRFVHSKMREFTQKSEKSKRLTSLSL